MLNSEKARNDAIGECISVLSDEILTQAPYKQAPVRFIDVSEAYQPVAYSIWVLGEVVKKLESMKK